MPLIVEDGTCVADADSWVSLGQARTLAASYGFTLPDDDDEAETVLRFGALWLSNNFHWKGSRACSVSLLAWPRTGVTDCEDAAVADDAIPLQIKIAQVYAAANRTVLNPIVTPGQQVKREKVDVIEVEYMTPRDQGVADGAYDPSLAARPILSFVDDLIGCFGIDDSQPALPWPFVV